MNNLISKYKQMLEPVKGLLRDPIKGTDIDNKAINLGVRTAKFVAPVAMAAAKQLPSVVRGAAKETLVPLAQSALSLPDFYARTLPYAKKNAQYNADRYLNQQMAAQKSQEMGNYGQAKTLMDNSLTNRRMSESYYNMLDPVKKQMARDSLVGGAKSLLMASGVNAGAKAVAGASALGGALGGAFAKLGGQDVAEGVGRGIGSGLITAGLGNITNPIIDPIVEYAGLGKSLLPKILSRGLAQGTLNTLEDNTFNLLTNGKLQNIDENTFSFALGAIISPLNKYNPNQKSVVKLVNDKLVFDGKQWRNLIGQYAKQNNVPLATARKGAKAVEKWVTELVDVPIKRGEQIIGYTKIQRIKAIMQDQGGGVGLDQPGYFKNEAPEEVRRIFEPISTKTKNGYTFGFIRNKEKAGNYGERFGQNIEPSGRYMNIDSIDAAMKRGQQLKADNPNIEYGKVTFKKPLYIEWGEAYQSGKNWKDILSVKYGGKKGKELSQAIVDDGYDAIITYELRPGIKSFERGGFQSEVVDLTGIRNGRGDSNKNTMYAATGGMMGIEPYQDENGEWKVRYDPKKAALGLGATIGGQKAIKYADSTKFSSLLDKKPRFEIDDSRAKLKEGWFGKGIGGTTLDEIIDHEKLFKQYPQLKKVSVNIENFQGNAFYDPKKNNITISEANVDLADPKSSLLHEIQHAIQEVEGFARGGSPGGMIDLVQFKDKNKIADLQQSIDYFMSTGKGREILNGIDALISQGKQIDEIETAIISKYPEYKIIKEAGDEISRQNKLPKTAQDAYRLLSGELEARAVQRRMDMPAAQRGRVDPYAAEAMATTGRANSDDFITRFDGGVSQSRSNTDETLDLVRQAIDSGDEAAAKALYKTIPGSKPSLKSLIDEVDGYRNQLDNQMQGAIKSDAPDNDAIIKKFQSFLKSQGETQDHKTGLLYREHIPERLFGQSSDEVAASLGMTESEFLAEISKGLNIKGALKKAVEDPLLQTKQVKVKNSVRDMAIKGQPGLQVNKGEYGEVTGVSAQPGGVLSPRTIKKVKAATERRARAEFDQWQKAVAQQSGGNRTTGQAIDILSKSMRDNTKAASATDITGTKDISNLSKGWNTIYRNFKTVFGNKYPQVRQQILDPFDASKGKHIDDLELYAGKLESDIVKRLGIGKGTKESAATQLFGEGKTTKEQLIKQFGEDKASRIVAADQWFRQQYDQLLSEVNATRAKIYPNDPSKIIPRRSDYYRHFREMKEGFGALLNIFDTPRKIAPGLESISEQTKPRSKWLSFAQKRLGDQTDIDAVGGFIDYVQTASYAKNIDPHIQRFRNLREDMVKATSDVESKEYGQLNNFINYLDKYANDLSGKTNQADRIFQEYIPGGRKTFAAINWLNNRVKANTILANTSSSISQIFNVPQGIASAGPKYSAKGAGRYLSSLFTENKPMSKSTFIKERYADPFSKFDTGIINNGKKFGGWMISVLDDVGTKYIWNSHYEKALAEGISNPVKYADEITRNLVGGRGIGEVPLLQKAKVTQLVAPFQLEVANLWYVMKDFVDQKQFGKLATFFVAMHVMNKGAEKIRGSGVGFDPIDAMTDMWGIMRDEDDNKIVRAVGRGSGEILSNLPIGQTVAAVYPEYGFKVGDKQMPTRKEFFGDEDPTRFGSGLLAMKGLQDPIARVLPPFGGVQVKRSLEGLAAVKKGFSESKSGKVRFPIEKNVKNAVQAGVFGQYSLPEAREYFEDGGSVLGENQSELFKQSGNKKELYNQIVGGREAGSQEDKIREQVRSGSQAKVAGSKIIYYNSKTDQVESVDVGKIASMPESNNYERALKQREAWSKVGAIVDNLQGPERTQALQAIGISEPDAVYYNVARQDNDIKYAYLTDYMEKVENRTQLMQALIAGRKTVNKDKIVSDGVVDQLYSEGFISSAEKKQLKAIKDLDAKSKPVNKTSGSTKKVKAPKAKILKFSSTSATSDRVKRVKQRRSKQYSLTKVKKLTG